LVFHGHAHRGQLEGKTQKGVPVYNVSMPLLTRTFKDRPPFRLFDVALGGDSIGDPARTNSTEPMPARSPGRRVTDAVAS
jgi:hypothetical protein